MHELHKKYQTTAYVYNKNNTCNDKIYKWLPSHRNNIINLFYKKNLKISNTPRISNQNCQHYILMLIKFEYLSSTLYIYNVRAFFIYIFIALGNVHIVMAQSEFKITDKNYMELVYTF